MITLRKILSAQHQYKIMADQLEIQRRRLADMPSDTPGHKRLVKFIADMEQEINEFLDMEI
jgi:hypothetical protein